RLLFSVDHLRRSCPLFPSTTLFRSEDMGPHFPKWNTGNGHAVPAFTDAQLTAIANILAWAHKTHGVPLKLCPNSKPGSRGLAYQDRKSTRLNSSHVKISYAVFGLNE